MDKEVFRKKIYNPESTESVNDRKIFGGNPTSMFDLNKIKYQWAYTLWKKTHRTQKKAPVNPKSRTSTKGYTISWTKPKKSRLNWLR